MRLFLLNLTFFIFFTLPTRVLYGQSHFASTEQQFHDLFVTAGYSTAFGAALGAAFIGLTSKPGENLHYVAIGASAGFITGSLLGTYIILSPSFASKNAEPYSGYDIAQTAKKSPRLPMQINIQPIINSHQQKLESIVAIASFASW